MVDALDAGFRLDDRSVFPGEGKISSPAGESHLEPRVIDVLMLLARNAGSVVARGEIMETLWTGRCVGDETLTRCIYRLRAALGDSKYAPRFIETIPKRGYRLCVAPTPLRPAPASASAPSRAAMRVGVRVAGWVLVACALLSQSAWQHPAESAAPAAFSIAVMPFENMTPAPENDYLSEGLTEEVMNLLAQQPALRVIGRTSTFALGDSKRSVGEIAHLLGVRTVLEGSVRVSGKRIRVSVHLEDARGNLLWSRSYDATLADLIGIEERLAVVVVGGLQNMLEPNLRLPVGQLVIRHPGTRVSEAYELYLRGRYHLRRRGAPEIRRSIELFEQAVAKDPDFAEAWSALAVARLVLPFFSDSWHRTFTAMKPDIEAAANRAIELAPQMGEPYAVLAEINNNDWKFSTAERYYRKAIALDPGNAMLHDWYATQLREVGRISEHMKQLELARELDPLMPIVNGDLAWGYYVTGHDDEALEQQKVLEDIAGHPINVNLPGAIYIKRGQFDKALEAWHEGAQWTGRPTPWRDLIVKAVQDPSRLERTLDAMAAYANEGRFPPADLYFFYAYLGANDRAYDTVRFAIADKSLGLFDLWRPDMKQFREDPRFAALVRRIGLVDYWRKWGWPDACHPEGADFACD